MNLAGPEIGALHGGIIPELGCAAGSDNATGGDQVAAIGHLEAQPGILLDQQDADAGRADARASNSSVHITIAPR